MDAKRLYIWQNLSNMKKIKHIVGVLPFKYSLIFVSLLSMMSLCTVESSAKWHEYDYLLVHPCRVKVNDTLCYLIRKERLSYAKGAKKWDLFRGEFSNYYFEEGYMGALLVDKYDPYADTIHVQFQSSYICNNQYQYEKRSDCDCDEFRKHFEQGDMLYKSDLPIRNRLGSDLYEYAQRHPDWKGLEHIDKSREPRGLKKELLAIFAGTTVSGQKDGFDYVDLGLPSGRLWATYNVGAAQPTEDGDLFQWGVTQPKEKQLMWQDDWDSYEWGKSPNLTKYCVNSEGGQVDNKTILDSEDDAATDCWGPMWRMPTRDDAIELRRGCTWELCDDFNGTGVSGIVGTSIYNGNKIFLPQRSAYYWTSTLVHYNSKNAYVFKVFEGLGIAANVGRGKCRTYGYYVRAVVK